MQANSRAARADIPFPDPLVGRQRRALDIIVYTCNFHLKLHA